MPEPTLDDIINTITVRLAGDELEDLPTGMVISRAMVAAVVKEEIDSRQALADGAHPATLEEALAIGPKGKTKGKRAPRRKPSIASK